MNKKLFKGALVLFASILMAVSCSNNSTGGGNDGNGNGAGNSGEQQTEITKAALTEAFTAAWNGADSSRGLLIKASKNSKIESTKGSLELTVSGEDTLLATISISDSNLNTAEDGSLAKVAESIEELIVSSGSLTTGFATAGVVVTPSTSLVAQKSTGSRADDTATLTDIVIAAKSTHKFKASDFNSKTLTKLKIVVKFTNTTGSWAA